MRQKNSQEKIIQKAIQIVCKLDNKNPGNRDIQKIYDLLISTKK